MTGRFLAVIVILMAGPGGVFTTARAAWAETPVVAASSHPVADLLSRVGGDDFEVRALFGPGVHPRRPKAGKAALPEVLPLYIRIGGAFEGLSDRRETARAVRILDLSAGPRT